MVTEGSESAAFFSPINVISERTQQRQRKDICLLLHYCKRIHKKLKYLVSYNDFMFDGEGRILILIKRWHVQIAFRIKMLGTLCIFNCLQQASHKSSRASKNMI